ncbi:MAG: hypothetical protein ACM3U2_11935 [Deltaproteobacteria bacterium]
MIMNNRMEDLVPPEDATAEPPADRPSPADFALVLKAWVKDHPIPCFAAAFVAGAALAWIIKRK